MLTNSIFTVKVEVERADCIHSDWKYFVWTLIPGYVRYQREKCWISLDVRRAPAVFRNLLLLFERNIIR